MSPEYLSDSNGTRMTPFSYFSLILGCLGLIFHLTVSQSRVPSIDTAEIVYSWPVLEFDWINDQHKQDFMNRNLYIPENCICTGIKVYKGKTYLSLPRWRPGVPSTMNVVVEKNGRNVLRPYPSWEMQTVGDCDALQLVMSMAIDPNTGFMWMFDTGRVAILSDKTGSQETRSVCPPKFVIYDINKNVLVQKYEFPSSVVNPDSTSLNDIVLDYVEGEARYAYITDPREFKIVVFDKKENTSYFFQDLKSMSPELAAGTFIVNNITRSGNSGINGIAMSPSFSYVYFGPFGGFSIYQVPTSLLRVRENSFLRQYPEIRKVGERPSQSGGMMGTKNGTIYFPALTMNTLYKWELEKDRREQGVTEGAVVMKTKTEVVRDDRMMQWIDTFAVDENGYLWFTAPALQRWSSRIMDFSGKSGDNFYVWKIYINEQSYLHNASTRIRRSSPMPLNSAPQVRADLPFYLTVFHLVKMTLFCIPLTTAQHVYSPWIYGEFLCKAIGFMQGIYVEASVLTIVCMSVERYLAIRHPMRIRTLCSPSRVKQVIVLTWIVAIITMCPLAMYKKLEIYHVMFMKLSYCVEAWPSSRDKLGYEVFLLFIVYIIPGFLVVGLYAVIGCSLWQQDHTLQRANSMVSNEAMILGGRRKLARMMIIISILFAICWMPYFIINLSILFSRDPSVLMSLYPYALLLGHSHSAQNPILYFFMHRGFHDFVWRIFRCQCQKLQNNRQLSVSSQHADTEKTMMLAIHNGTKYSYEGNVRHGRHV